MRFRAWRGPMASGSSSFTPHIVAQRGVRAETAAEERLARGPPALWLPGALAGHSRARKSSGVAAPVPLRRGSAHAQEHEAVADVDQHRVDPLVRGHVVVEPPDLR